MTQTAIPYLLMRGGTSRGPYFNRADLPSDLDELAKVLISVIGSGHGLNIDGIGGGAAVTTKVAMLSKSNDEWADIDYFFAQVSVEDKLVDFKPTCGNILSGVAPAAIEMGLIDATDDETTVNILATNTGARVVAKLDTPNGELNYEGDAAIDGVPGTSSPIILNFKDVAGSFTGSLLPTGNIRDTIDGIEVSCIDVAMPMVIARAADFGLTGHEGVSELDENKEFFKRMEAVRIKAGALMGMGDVTKSVTPKFGLLAKAKSGGTIAARYFMPWATHPTMAVTGGQCIASCALLEGSIADGLLERSSSIPTTVTIEHPSGTLDVIIDYENGTDGFIHKSAGLMRTARKIASGHVYIPKSVWVV